MARPPNSWVWKYFSRCNEDPSNVGTVVVKCRICEKSMNYSSRNGPTNLSRHLSRSHQVLQSDLSANENNYEVTMVANNSIEHIENENIQNNITMNVNERNRIAHIDNSISHIEGNISHVDSRNETINLGNDRLIIDGYSNIDTNHPNATVTEYVTPGIHQSESNNLDPLTRVSHYDEAIKIDQQIRGMPHHHYSMDDNIYRGDYNNIITEVEDSDAFPAANTNQGRSTHNFQADVNPFPQYRLNVQKPKRITEGISKVPIPGSRTKYNQRYGPDKSHRYIPPYGIYGMSENGEPNSANYHIPGESLGGDGDESIVINPNSMRILSSKDWNDLELNDDQRMLAKSLADEIERLQSQISSVRDLLKEEKMKSKVMEEQYAIQQKLNFKLKQKLQFHEQKISEQDSKLTELARRLTNLDHIV